MSGRQRKPLGPGERERRYQRRAMRKLRAAVRSVHACELCGALWPVGDPTERCAQQCPARIARAVAASIDAAVLGGDPQPQTPIGLLPFVEWMQR